MKRLRWKMIVVAGVLSSFGGMLLALGVVRLLTSSWNFASMLGFQGAFTAMLLLVMLTPIFSSMFSFASLYALAWEARAVNAWIGVVVALCVDFVVGVPLLLLSVIAAR